MNIRPATAADLPAIIELFRLSLGEAGGVPSADFWRWKHAANPFGTSPTTLMVTEAGQIVGLRTFMYWGWRWGGKTLRSLRCVDTATHPDFRGQGIFKRLTLDLVARAERDSLADFIFNTPNEMSRPGYLKMGWEEAGRTDLYLRPMWRLLGGTTAAPPPVVGDYLVNYDLTKLADLLATSCAAMPDRLLRTDYSIPYLDWRYRAVPGISYELAHTPTLDACFFYRLKQTRGLLELRVMDYFWADRRGQRRLFGLMRRTASRHGAQAISILRYPEQSVGSLLRQGFLPLRRQGLIVTRKVLGNAAVYEALTTDRDWFLTSGVVELF